MNIDDALRALLHTSWSFDAAPPELLALGRPALDRLLDAKVGELFPTEMEWRDYGVQREHAIAAFAKADIDGVLTAMKKRKWTDAAIASSGIALVQDARLVPILVSLYADREPLSRKAAVEYLGNQRDPLATAAVIRALRDRSSDVRLAAIRALGNMGDLDAIEPLTQLAERNRSPLIEPEVKAACRKIRARSRSK